MLNKKQVKKIFDTSFDIASSQSAGSTYELEVSIDGSDVATSRFACNQMTQNQAPSTHTFSLRLVKDKRQIRLSTCDTSSQGLTRIVDKAFESVKFTEPDDEILEMVEPEKNGCEIEDLRPLIIDTLATGLSATNRAELVSEMIKVARDNGLDSAGVVSNGSKIHAFANTKGLFHFHRESYAQSSVTMVSEDSSGWAKGQSPRMRDVSPILLANTACYKALNAKNPRDIEPGRYTTILEPSAVLDLLGFMLWDFAATSHLDRKSCLLDKVGGKVFGDNINIYDDAFHNKQNGPLFDGEGLKRNRVCLVEKGVLKNLVYGRRSARRMKTESSGHGLPEPSNFGEYPMNLVVEGGESTVDEMIKSTKKGILLSRAWYVRTVDPARKIVTGMSRDGTYMIEDGEIAYGVKNLRFNVSLLELLNKVEMLSEPVLAAGEESSPAVVPAMKVRDFNFTEVTKF